MTDLDPWTDPDIAANNRAAESGHGSRAIVWRVLFPHDGDWTPSYPEAVVTGD